MKKLLLIGYLLFVNTLFAQVDKKWVVGYLPSILQFNQSGTINYPMDSPVTMAIINTSANICNEDGELQFFSNGVFLFDKYGDTVEEGTGFHPPLLADFYDIAASSSQAALILPKKNGLYYYFHYSMSDYNFAHNMPFDLLYYSVVDMNANGGKGKVISKNNLLLKDSLLDAYGMTACRHANGRDWWLIKIKYLKNGYYKYLITPDTITGPSYQLIEHGVFGTPTSFGQSVFSNNGDLLASTNYRGGVRVMSFDRCTGEITPWLTLAVPIDSITQHGVGGNALSFSASGNFLYVNTFKEVYQFNLADTNVQQSIVKVGMEDTSYNTMFEQSQIGSDGKIYIGNFNGFTNSLSVIHQPEIKGVGCNFKYHSDTIYGSLAVGSPPNMPNYHLGAQYGSVCDTIVSETGTIADDQEEFLLYPNPASSTVYLQLNSEGKEPVEFNLYDVLGNIVLRYSLISDKTVQTISLENTNAGTYFYCVQTSTGFKITGKLMVFN
jgi:hypothetical protein